MSSQNQRQCLRPKPIETRCVGDLLLSWPQAPKRVKGPVFAFQAEEQQQQQQQQTSKKMNKTQTKPSDCAMMIHRDDSDCRRLPGNTTRATSSGKDLKVSAAGLRINTAKASKANTLPKWPKTPRAAGSIKRKYSNPRVLQELDINLVPVPKRSRFSCNSSGI